MLSRAMSLKKYLLITCFFAIKNILTAAYLSEFLHLPYNVLVHGVALNLKL